MSNSIQKIRQDFPILKRLNRVKPLVYLDNAASSQKPDCVIEALAEYYKEHNSNVHRGVYALA
ncbi:MAG: aminotransferase class V-fold PLP-dependent enzyme, partial [Opitutae bacterium]|nr:aminotransferase class V-fold PLP-dependent enzyme [Opitutae bacterium]